MGSCLNLQPYMSSSSERKRHLLSDMLSGKLFIFILHLSLKVVTTFSGYLFCTTFLPLTVLSAWLVFICQQHISSYFKYNFWKDAPSFCFILQPSPGEKFSSAHPPLCFLLLFSMEASDSPSINSVLFSIISQVEALEHVGTAMSVHCAFPGQMAQIQI